MTGKLTQHFGNVAVGSIPTARGQRWVQAIGPEDLDPALLMFGACRQIDPVELPIEHTVVGFEFRGLPKDKHHQRNWWLVMQRQESEICLKNPRFDVDAVITTDLAAFAKLVLGYIGLQDAVGRGLVAFSGSDAAITLLCRLMKLPPKPMQKTFRYGPYPPREVLALDDPATAKQTQRQPEAIAVGQNSPLLSVTP
jgi:hypothetical protein